MAQAGAVFKVGEVYLRMKESGSIFPFNEEQGRLVKKDQADFVRCEEKTEDGYRFEVVKLGEDAEPKKISTPMRRPEVVTAQPATPSTVEVVTTSAGTEERPKVVVANPPKIDLSA